ncbi:MAG: hypothetical protein C5B58_10930 [Acidobacteria bacterium]|nr:MAG: hypothetical protein C5B58_10930 [Acidobacteriota bacterium]
MIDAKRGVKILEWRPFQKNTLQGFVRIELPSGLILNHVAIHEQGASRWICPPAREWKNRDGVKAYAKFIEFTSRTVGDRFRDAVLGALDTHLAGHEPSEFAATTKPREVLR